MIDNIMNEKQNLMFKNQKKVMDFLNKQKVISRGHFYRNILSVYDNISFLHGSGKELYQTRADYNQFMEDKWCMVYDISIKIYEREEMRQIEEDRLRRAKAYKGEWIG